MHNLMDTTHTTNPKSKLLTLVSCALRSQATGELVFVEMGEGSAGELPHLLRSIIARLKVTTHPVVCLVSVPSFLLLAFPLHFSSWVQGSADVLRVRTDRTRLI